MTFGAWIATRIVEAGGLNELARRAGVNGSTVMAWRDERVFPLPDMVEHLARVVGVSADDLHAMVFVARLKRAHQRRALTPRRGATPSSTVRLPLGKAFPAGSERLVRSAVS